MAPRQEHVKTDFKFQTNHSAQMIKWVTLKKLPDKLAPVLRKFERGPFSPSYPEIPFA